MTPDQVLSIKPRVLTQSQREFYFNEGYILLERVIGDDWIAKLRAATEEMVERSRKVSVSDKVFDLEPGHTPDAHRGCDGSRIRSSITRSTGTMSRARPSSTSWPIWWVRM